MHVSSRQTRLVNFMRSARMALTAAKVSQAQDHRMGAIPLHTEAFATQTCLIEWHATRKKLSTTTALARPYTRARRMEISTSGKKSINALQSSRVSVAGDTISSARETSLNGFQCVRGLDKVIAPVAVGDSWDLTIPQHAQAGRQQSLTEQSKTQGRAAESVTPLIHGWVRITVPVGDNRRTA